MRAFKSPEILAKRGSTLLRAVCNLAPVIVDLCARYTVCSRDLFI